MTSILYLYPAYTSFIRIDEEHLKSAFTVRSHYFNPNPKWLTPFRLLAQFFFLLWNIHRYDAIVIQFAGYHSIIPVILGRWFRKPVLIIVAGTDAALLPSIDYGNYRKKLLAFCTSYSLKHCTHILPVDSSMIEQDYVYDDAVPAKQGYNAFDSHINTPYTVIPYGFDDSVFHRQNSTRITNSFITVTQSTRPPLYYRKGIDLILEAAKRFPGYLFTIVGDDYLCQKDHLPTNLKLISRVPHEQLIHLLNEHEFYFQLSMFEGFPNALGEAMLCGCIPIGSSVSAIPYMIDDCGFILRKKSIHDLEALINMATLSDKQTLSKKAEERVKSLFSAQRRRQALINAVKSCIQS